MTDVPRLICVGGISGAGKSTLARALAAHLGAILLRSDVTRKQLAGVPPERRLPPSGYTAAMDAKVLRRLALDGRATLRAKNALVVDATFLDPAVRACAADIARAAQIRFDGIWLTLPATEAARRVTARVGDISDATAEVVHRQMANARPPDDWHLLQATLPADQIAAAALRALALPRDLTYL